MYLWFGLIGHQKLLTLQVGSFVSVVEHIMHSLVFFQQCMTCVYHVSLSQGGFPLGLALLFLSHSAGVGLMLASFCCNISLVFVVD